MLRGYQLVCVCLRLFGLRSTATPAPCNTESAYQPNSLHFANWAFLYEGANSVPQRSPLTPWGRAWSMGVFMLVSVHPVLQIHKLVCDGGSDVDLYRYSNAIFAVIVPLQFACAYIYLRTDHIEPHLSHLLHDNGDASEHPFMTSTSSSSASRDDISGVRDVQKIVPMFRRGLTGARQCHMRRLQCIRSIVWTSAVVFSVTVVAVGLVDGYENDASYGFPLGVSVISTVGMIVGTAVQAICVILFSTVFYNHSVDLLHTCECLSVCQNDDRCVSSTVMNYLLRHIALLKYSVGTSIRQLHGMFSSFSVPWAVGFAICVHTLVTRRSDEHPRIRDDTLCYSVCYGLVQALYVVLIHHIHRGKQMIVDAIHVPTFILANLGRSIVPARDVLDMMERSECDASDMWRRCNLSLLMENASTMDWIAVNNTLQQDWTHFQFVGLSLNDSSMLKRCAALVGVIIGGRYLFSV